ncbi:LAFA_0B00650g1_1 [Lachancea sp. 'fantastica']|nr:LAFA_0B00650g1_1 [Lachancea sp. 'fantastica']
MSSKYMMISQKHFDRLLLIVLSAKHRPQMTVKDPLFIHDKNHQNCFSRVLSLFLLEPFSLRNYFSRMEPTPSRDIHEVLNYQYFILGKYHTHRGVQTSSSRSVSLIIAKPFTMFESPSSHLREPRFSKLPAELFSSKMSWKLHDLAKAKYFYVWLFTLAIFPFVAVIVVKSTSSWSSPLTQFITFMSGELVLATLPFAYFFKKQNSIAKLRSLLVKEVVELGSGFDHASWVLIARHANEYLREEGLWHSNLCIYDGEECLRLFRSQVYLPFVNSSSIIQEEQLAVQIYEKSNESYWNSTELIEITMSLKPHQNLPIDTYRFSLVYDLAYGAKQALFYLPAVMLFYSLLAWRFDPAGIAVTSVLGILQTLPGFFLYTRLSRKQAPSTPKHVLMLFKMEQQLVIGESAKEWDEVAKEMNFYLNNEGVMRDRRVFFDGKECHARFQSLLASTLSCDGFEKSLYPELIQFATDCRTV